MNADKLTPRERAVMDLIAKGVSTKDAAKQLGIAFTTARNHIANALKGLGVSSRIEAIDVLRRDRVTRARELVAKVSHNISVASTGYENEACLDSLSELDTLLEKM